MTKEEILASANDEQQEAIKHQEGACMIIAGPGSCLLYTSPSPRD